MAAIRQKHRGLVWGLGLLLALESFPALAGSVVIQSGPHSKPTTSTNPPQPTKQNPGRKRPDWEAVEQSMRDSFSKLKHYKSGDILTQDDVNTVLANLKNLGWEIPNPKLLSDRFLPASDEMVKQLRTPQGNRLMRDIAQVPEGYDRLDRLRKLPYGSRRLRELIVQPEGSKLIEYMATTPGGKNMGRQLSVPAHANFNAKTKRLYNESQLLAELKQLYDAESASLAK